MLGIGNLLGSAFGVVGSALNSVVGGLRDLGTSAFAGVGTILDGTVIGLGDMIVTATSALAGGLSGMVGTLANWAGGVWNSAATFLNNGFVDIVKVISPEVAEEMPRVEESYSDYFENIGGVVGDVISNIGGAFEGVGSGISILSAEASSVGSLSAAAPTIAALSAAPVAAPATLEFSVAPAAGDLAPQAAPAVVGGADSLVQQLSEGETIVLSETALPVGDANVNVAEFLTAAPTGTSAAEGYVYHDAGLAQVNGADLYDVSSIAVVA